MAPDVIINDIYPGVDVGVGTTFPDAETIKVDADVPPHEKGTVGDGTENNSDINGGEVKVTPGDSDPNKKEKKALLKPVKYHTRTLYTHEPV